MTAYRYSYRPNPPPTRVYCDANFLLDLFTAADPSRIAKIPAPHQVRARDATRFYRWAIGKNVVLCTSLLALEEIHRQTVITPINSAMDKLRKQGKAVHGWKDLRRSDKALFDKKLAEGRAMLRTFDAYLRTLNLHVLMFGRQAVPNENQLCRSIAAYARNLLLVFHLDGMDAYHVAVARYCDIQWAATSDSDWSPIPRLNAIGAA